MSKAMIRRLTLAAALALSVGFAIPSWAGNTADPSSSPSVVLNYAAKSCSISERTAIAEAFALAKERIGIAIRTVREQPDHPKITEWFGAASRKQIQAVLEGIKARLDQSNDVQIECEPNRCQQLGSPFAYAIPRLSRMGFCSRFFRSALTGEDSRFGTVVHEVSHLVGTDDHAASRPNARALAAKDPAKAAENGDNYEYFVETLTD